MHTVTQVVDYMALSDKEHQSWVTPELERDSMWRQSRASS
jgi:hypothetical protein